MFTWSVERGYLDRNPSRDGARLLIKAEREDNKRHRRVSPELEAKLLEEAAPHLRLMIIAALDTGMCRDEMLALTLADVDERPGWLRLRGTEHEVRQDVIAADRDRPPAGLWTSCASTRRYSKPSDARVFSNEAGEPIQGFRTAWDAAVLRAHGHQPTRTSEDGKGLLMAECREALRKIDLRWHDLRHAHASRPVELGVPMSQLRDLLGHASITTTERYDNQRPDALEAAVKRSKLAKVSTNPSSFATSTGEADTLRPGEDDENPLDPQDLESGVGEGIRTPNIRSHSPALCP